MKIIRRLSIVLNIVLKLCAGCVWLGHTFDGDLVDKIKLTFSRYLTIVFNVYHRCLT